MIIEPTKTPSAPLDPVSEPDLIVEYVLSWIVDAELQLRGDSGVVGPTRLEAVTDLVTIHIVLPLLNRRHFARTMTRLIYGAAFRDLPAELRSKGQTRL